MLEHSYYPNIAWLSRVQRCCLGLLFFHLVLCQPVTAAVLKCPAGDGERTVLIRFRDNSTAIDSPSRKRLVALSEQAKLQAGAAVVVQGFTGKTNVTPDYALALGDKYAQAVRKHMLNLGIAPERISTLSMGKNGPLSAGSGACVRWQPLQTHRFQGSTQ